MRLLIIWKYSLYLQCTVGATEGAKKTAVIPSRILFDGFPLGFGAVKDDFLQGIAFPKDFASDIFEGGW